MGGIMISSTSDETIFPNAAPITTPTARSITLPRIANSLNSFSIAFSLQQRSRFCGSPHADCRGISVLGRRALPLGHYIQPRPEGHERMRENGGIDFRDLQLRFSNAARFAANHQKR